MKAGGLKSSPRTCATRIDTQPNMRYKIDTPTASKGWCVTTRRRAAAVVSATRFVTFQSRLALAFAGAAHGEFWRRFSEGRCQRSWCNERSDQGSISWVPLSGDVCRTNLGALTAASCIPGSNKSRMFSGLSKRPPPRKRAFVKSLDTFMGFSPPHPVTHTGSDNV